MEFQNLPSKFPPGNTRNNGDPNIEALEESQKFTGCATFLISGCAVIGRDSGLDLSSHQRGVPVWLIGPLQ